MALDIGNDRSSVPESREAMAALLKELVVLSVKGLEWMFHDESRMFSFRAKAEGEAVVNEGLSRRYTIISLLGLQRFRCSGGRCPLDTDAILAELAAHPESIDNIGDLGLLLWLIAEFSPDLAEEFYSRAAIMSAPGRYRDALDRKTMQLSWFLTGLSHLALSAPHLTSKLQRPSAQIFDQLMKNYGGKGIFGHMSATSVAGSIRGRIGTFADQVYPIYALTRYSEAFAAPRALALAVDCATAICAHQGSQGQWWWHYHAATGQVTRKYPVYSVHQDGMAPMALLAVGKAAGRTFEREIYKGLRWITGANELTCDLRHPAGRVIWRCFYKPRHRLYLDELLSLLAIRRDGSDGLKVLHECRSYHLGWLLYAFADESTVLSR